MILFCLLFASRFVLPSFKFLFSSFWFRLVLVLVSFDDVSSLSEPSSGFVASLPEQGDVRHVMFWLLCSLPYWVEWLLIKDLSSHKSFSSWEVQKRCQSCKKLHWGRVTVSIKQSTRPTVRDSIAPGPAFGVWIQWLIFALRRVASSFFIFSIT